MDAYPFIATSWLSDNDNLDERIANLINTHGNAQKIAAWRAKTMTALLQDLYETDWHYRRAISDRNEM